MKLFEYMVGAVIVAAVVLALTHRQVAADIIVPIIRSLRSL